MASHLHAKVDLMNNVLANQVLLIVLILRLLMQKAQ